MEENGIEVKVIGDNINPEKKPLYSNILNNEHSRITKIIMENISFPEYIYNSTNFENLKSFNVKNSKLPEDDFLQKMPELNELTVKSIPNLKIDYFQNLPLKIQKLYLEKNNFIDQDFRNIFNFNMAIKDEFLKNLQCLSFAGNNLTRIDFSFL